jgi:hypothetical protein
MIRRSYSLLSRLFLWPILELSIPQTRTRGFPAIIPGLYLNASMRSNTLLILHFPNLFRKVFSLTLNLPDALFQSLRTVFLMLDDVLITHYQQPLSIRLFI